jgi:hypothetical protein
MLPTDPPYNATRGGVSYLLVTFLTLIRRSYGQTATSRPWVAMAQITNTSTAIISSDQNG